MRRLPADFRQWLRSWPRRPDWEAALRRWIEAEEGPGVDFRLDEVNQVTLPGRADSGGYSCAEGCHDAGKCTQPVILSEAKNLPDGPLLPFRATDLFGAGLPTAPLPDRRSPPEEAVGRPTPNEGAFTEKEATGCNHPV
jgi:hypothetical protein